MNDQYGFRGLGLDVTGIVHGNPDIDQYYEFGLAHDGSKVASRSRWPGSPSETQSRPPGPVYRKPRKTSS